MADRGGLLRLTGKGSKMFTSRENDKPLAAATQREKALFGCAGVNPFLCEGCQPAPTQPQGVFLLSW